MSNYKRQAPAPNMQLLFQQAIYNPSDRACMEGGAGVSNAGMASAQRRSGRAEPCEAETEARYGREQQRAAKIPCLNFSPAPDASAPGAQLLARLGHAHGGQHLPKPTLYHPVPPLPFSWSSAQ